GAERRLEVADLGVDRRSGRAGRLEPGRLRLGRAGAGEQQRRRRDQRHPPHSHPRKPRTRMDRASCGLGAGRTSGAYSKRMGITRHNPASLGAVAKAIEVRDLRKSYGPVEAVRGLSFAVESGEVFGLLGPNGAGKTTTVEILEGFRERSG